MQDDRGVEDSFPDVRTGARRALWITLCLVVLYGGIFAIFGRETRTSDLELVASLGLGSGLLILGYVDLRTGLLPDILTWPLVAFGLGYAAHSGDLRLALAGAVIGYGLIAGLAYFWRQTRGYEGIGLGDAKLLAAGGAWVGAIGLPMILLVASTAGLLVALTVSQITRYPQDRAAIAFGPCLGLGTWIVWVGINLLG